MSLPQLEYFIAIAEAGGVERASRRLHVAQPALSRQLRRLEDELGVTLFDRTPRGMKLRPAGASFLADARRILASIEQAKRTVRAHG